MRFSEVIARRRFAFQEGSKAHLRRLAKRSELVPVRIGPGLSTATHVVVMVMRNEVDRLEAFLRHYRDLGFQHFLVIDNDSDDGTRDMVLAQPDASLYRAGGSYARSRFGNDWINTVLSRHCVGKWILYADADEILQFPHWAEQGVARLTSHLEARGDASMSCLMLDMYSRRKVGENLCAAGVDPLTVCDLFDGTGYETRHDALSATDWTKGGVRARVFFGEAVWDGPALNKTPLVKWRAHYAFLKSAHQLWPFRLNRGAAPGPGSVTGVLLHFKFLATLPSKLAEEVQRQEHTAEYSRYGNQWDGGGPDLHGPESRRYHDWTAAAACGLMRGEGWASVAEADAPTVRATPPSRQRVWRDGRMSSRPLP